MSWRARILPFACNVFFSSTPRSSLSVVSPGALYLPVFSGTVLRALLRNFLFQFRAIVLFPRLCGSFSPPERAVPRTAWRGVTRPAPSCLYLSRTMSLIFFFLPRGYSLRRALPLFFSLCHSLRTAVYVCVFSLLCSGYASDLVSPIDG